jgi:hypothetical protein
MRTVLTQDAVFLRVDYPHNSIFGNSLFQEPDFLQYESALLEISHSRITSRDEAERRLT